MARASLTTDRVVAEAERIADEVGLTNLTLAALATSLGVRQPSLYKHIAGMGALQRSIAVRAKRELSQVLGGAAVGRSRDDAVREVAAAYRTWATVHPGRYAATVRAPAPGDAEDEDASAAAIGVLTNVLTGYAIQGEDAVHSIRTVRAALHGFVALDSAGGFGLPVDVDRSFDALVEGLVVALRAREPTLP